MTKFYPNSTIGILGGGQLGKMVLHVANRLNLNVAVLDPDASCPASSICTRFVQGSFLDFETVLEFGRSVDIITIEIENVNTDALAVLESEGKMVFPSVKTIQTLKDKSTQKAFYKANSIPSPFYTSVSGKCEFEMLLSAQEISIPCVWKASQGGYDGRGVFVLKSADDIDSLADVPAIVEELIDISKEISIIVSRNPQAVTSIFPPVGMIFDEKTNQVDQVYAPVNLTPQQFERANELALLLANELKLIGVMAVEMFVDSKGNILVNEIAPRPHNSGHLTIESNYTSQFEQHLRAILNLPPGNTQLKHPSVMVNIIGAEGYEGDANWEGITEVFSISGASVHNYGKRITKPNRKLGHVTVSAENLDKAFEKISIIKNHIYITA